MRTSLGLVGVEVTFNTLLIVGWILWRYPRNYRITEQAETLTSKYKRVGN